ncbi:ATP-binding protein [Streptomyces sp. NPDC014006]|uniref:ATP-binding protein n=1 Tax=Streptomyces sp. NPDC014006 TaxID=3364870 RepID=UPI003700BEEC
MIRHRPGTGVGPSRHTVLDSDSETPVRARRVCRRYLRQLVPPVVGRAADDVELVVSELVTNVVRHAHSATCMLSLDARPDAVEVTVVDSDPTPPCSRLPDLSGQAGGFGWSMVRRLAKRVTVVPVPSGKAVCVLMPRPAPA